MAQARATTMVQISGTYHEVPLANAVPEVTNPFSDDKVLSGAGTKFRRTRQIAAGASYTAWDMLEYRIPNTFVAGSTITLEVTCHVDGALGTSQQVDAEVWKQSSDGTVSGSDLCGTGAQAITTSSAAYTFSISGGTLSAGDRILILIGGILNNGGGGAARNMYVSRVRMSTVIYGGF